MWNFKDGLKSLTNQIINSRNGRATNSFSSERVSEEELKAISKTGIGRKIVQIKATNVFKEGITCKDEKTRKFVEDNLIPEMEKAVESMLSYGRGIVVIMGDSENLSEPLSTSNINRLKFKFFSGYNLTTTVTNTTNIKKESYNKPTYYHILNEKIHYSRVLDFTYAEPVETDKPDYFYGGISEYELIYNQLVNDAVIERAVPTLIEKVSSFFYKVSGFKQLLQQKKEKDLLTYFSNLENLRSIYGAGVIDKDDDTVMQNQSLAGVDSIDKISLRRLAFVTGIPVSWLVGESVQGLNSTGDNETSIFWSMIKSLSNRYIEPVINEKLKELNLSTIEINDQQQMTPNEKAIFEGQVLNNAILVQQLGFDIEEYINSKNIEVKVKSEFSNYFPNDEEVEE